MCKHVAGWKFETLDGENGFEFEIEGGSDVVKKLTDIMETVEQDKRKRTIEMAEHLQGAGAPAHYEVNLADDELDELPLAAGLHQDGTIHIYVHGADSGLSIVLDDGALWVRVDEMCKHELKDERTVQYPECDKSMRVGIFCEHCGLVMYVDQYHVDPIMRKGCPDCGGDLIWIRPDQQPEGDGF